VTRWPDAARRPGRYDGLRRLVAPSLVGLALSLSARGGAQTTPGVASVGSSSTTTSPDSRSQSAGSVAADYAEKTLKYSRCMRAHGVPAFPDPNSAGLIFPRKGQTSEQDEPGYKGANNVCCAPGSELWEADASAHGIPNFPDPKISSRFIGFQIDIREVNSELFKRANQACSSYSLGGP
jgi:hypothetical protein